MKRTRESKMGIHRMVVGGKIPQPADKSNPRLFSCVFTAFCLGMPASWDTTSCWPVPLCQDFTICTQDFIKPHCEHFVFGDQKTTQQQTGSPGWALGDATVAVGDAHLLGPHTPKASPECQTISQTKIQNCLFFYLLPTRFFDMF